MLVLASLVAVPMFLLMQEALLQWVEALPAMVTALGVLSRMFKPFHISFLEG